MEGLKLSNKIKKEFIIEGLCCANCATKIEDRVGKLEEVNAASMNLITNILSIEIKDADKLEDVLKKTTNIVKTVEPDAIMSENIITNSGEKILLVTGLCCANCATKIETKSKKIQGIKSISMDFISSKLVLEVENKNEMNRIVDEVVKIVKLVEPDAIVTDEENKKKTVNRKGLLARFKR
jgi:Cd2+/Zn2+-exporting ATPase